MIHGFCDYIQLFFNSSCFISSRISINAKWLIIILLVAFCLINSSNDHVQCWHAHMSAMYWSSTPGPGCCGSDFGETKPQSPSLGLPRPSQIKAVVEQWRPNFFIQESLCEWNIVNSTVLTFNFSFPFAQYIQETFWSGFPHPVLGVLCVHFHPHSAKSQIPTSQRSLWLSLICVWQMKLMLVPFLGLILKHLQPEPFQSRAGCCRAASWLQACCSCIPWNRWFI